MHYVQILVKKLLPLLEFQNLIHRVRVIMERFIIAQSSYCALVMNDPYESV